MIQQEGVEGIGGGLGDPVVDAFEDLEPVGRVDEVRCRLSPTGYQIAPPSSEKPNGGNSRRLLLPDVESEPGSGPDHDKSECAKDRGERQEEGGEPGSPDGGEQARGQA